MMNWNEPTTKPSHGARVVVLHNRGKSATIGRYDSVEWKGDPCIVCDMGSHDIWWEHVTAWIYAPGEVPAVSLEQRINAIIEAHEKELVEIQRAIAKLPEGYEGYIDHLKGRAFSETYIIKDLKKAVKAAGE